jgi:predicted methyltransferase
VLRRHALADGLLLRIASCDPQFVRRTIMARIPGRETPAWRVRRATASAAALVAAAMIAVSAHSEGPSSGGEPATPARAQIDTPVTGVAEPPAAAARTASSGQVAQTGAAAVEADERDQYSKPREVFEFAGVGPGSVVVDVGAGSGYNTAHLVAAVGPAGKVFAVGGNDSLAQRAAGGDLAGGAEVVIVGKAADVPDGVADVVLLIREFHLAPDHPAYLANVRRMLKPRGTAALVEVRSGQPVGYDHTTHRSGEQTIIDEFEAGGFEFVGSSDLLRRDGDDYSAYAPAGQRYKTDRMLLLFRKPG